MKSILRFRKALFVALSLFTLQLNAANFYWVGGSGSWSDYNTHWATTSGGQIFWAHVPTPTDTVIFDSLSFTGMGDTVIADNQVYCHTMKWLTSDSMPNFIHLGNQPILRIYGSLQLDTSVNWYYQGKIIFCAIDTGNTIQTNGANLMYVQFRGDTAASWELLDTFRVYHLIFNSGNFYSRGNTIITTVYEQGYSNLSRQYLDTSSIIAYKLRYVSNPLVFDADSVSVTLLGDTLEGGNFHFKKVECLSIAGLSGMLNIDTLIVHTNVYIVGTNTIGNFSCTRPGTMLTMSGTLTANGSFTFNGACSGMSAIVGSGTINFVAPGVILQTVFIDGVNANGNPTVNNSVIQGGIGWTSTNNPIPRTLYWVNGQGQWSDTLHWSNTSGGIGNECSPLPIDDVTIDANSFTTANEICDADNHITLFNDFVVNGTTFTPNIIQDTGVVFGFGDLKVLDPVLWNIGIINLRSGNPNTVIDIGSNSLYTINIYGAGTFQQLSPLHAFSLGMSVGGYYSNANPITSGSVGFGSLSGSCDFGGSTIYAPRWTAATVAGSFVAPDSLTSFWITDYNSHSYNKVFSPSGLTLGGNSTFKDLLVGGSAVISGNNTFDTLIFTGSDIEILLSGSSTQTITGDLQINSSCATPVTMKSLSPGVQAYISKASGVINCDYLVLEDVGAIGGATFNATNTCAMLNVSGWNVTPPPAAPMYWVGGTGDWKDPMHWSYSSGGPTGGCIPHPLTDVYFDANSFSSGGSVNMNVKNGYCHNMDWTSSTGNPSFSAPAQANELHCFGSLILEQGVTTYGVNLYMRASTTGNVINPKNATVGNLTLEGTGGQWDLLDTLGCDTLDLRTGAFYTNGNAIDAYMVMSQSGNPRELHLDTSAVVTGSWLMTNDANFVFDATDASVTANGVVFQGAGYYYDEVVLGNAVALTDANTYRQLKVTGSVSISGTQHIDTLILQAGGEMIRLSSDTIFVDSCIIANSNSSSYIGIQAMSPIERAYISKPTDTVCIDYMILQGIDASGGATFFAGASSSDVADNNGWQWQTCAGMVTVWPGDANYDLVADNFDILSIGIAFGETGGQRPNASLNWIAQPNYEWNREFADSTDIVHSDCDGDGVIGFSDTTAVSLNYGQTHPARLAAPDEAQSVGAEIKLLVTQAAWQPGDTVTIPIWLGTQNSPVNSAYGLGFTLNWDYPYVEPGTMEFDYNNSWFLDNGTNNVHLEKPFYNSQYCDLGMSRIDHNNTSGSGELVMMRFVLTQNANGPLKFWFTNYKMIDFAEDTLPMFSTGGTINAAVGIIEPVPTEISVYPNPTSSSLVVNTGLQGNGTITLYDVAGRVAKQFTTDNITSTTVDLAGLEAGYYFLLAESEAGSAQVRVQKL